MVEELMEHMSRIPTQFGSGNPAIAVMIAIVVAMGTCLAGMLGALLDEGQCTPDDIRELLRGIESEIVPPQGPAKE